MLLVRGLPMLGESLSSFRQRIWQKNIYRLFPVISPELRRSDPDLQFNPMVISALSKLVDLSEEEILRMTLWSMRLVRDQNKDGLRRIPQWVSLLQYARRDIGTGSHFCPICLIDANEIYFRLPWRLSIFVSCPVHEVQMRNQCPQCGFPAWPYAAASASGYFYESLELDQCPRCRGLLRESPVAAETNPDVLACVSQAVEAQPVSPIGPITATHSEQFAAIRGVINTALRRRSRSKHERSGPFSASVHALNQQEIWSTPFDHLALSIRHDLLEAAWPTLKNWPDNFLRFTRDTGITVVDFHEDRPNLPNWMLAEIDGHLGQVGRYVTTAQVDQAIKQLKEEGLPINAQRVSKLVGSLSAKAVMIRLKKRIIATPDERLSFALGLNNYMHSSSSKRKSSARVRARNVLAVGLAIFKKTTVERSVNLIWDDVNAVLASEHPSEPWAQQLLEVMSRAKLIVLSTQVQSSGRAGYFRAHKGDALSVRGPRQAFLWATSGLDEGLRKRIASFFPT